MDSRLALRCIPHSRNSGPGFGCVGTVPYPVCMVCVKILRGGKNRYLRANEGGKGRSRSQSGYETPAKRHVGVWDYKNM